MIAVFRDADWLNAGRARAWCRTLAGVTLLGSIVWIGLARHGMDLSGKPLGTDFLSFWAASHLVLTGLPGAVYDPTAHAAVERMLFPTVPVYYAFFYPPPFLLICLPFALLPFFASLAIWLLASFLLFFVCCRCVLPQRWAVLPIFAFPAVVVNAGHGQNGFLSAACFAGGTLLLEQRPVLAGMCFGLLVYKPQLLLVVPIALLFARRWRALLGLALSATGVCAASWVVLGEAAWRGFLRAAPLARATLVRGLVQPWKMQSTFAAMRLLHGPLWLSYGVQGLLTLTVLVLVGSVAVRRPGAQAEGALLVTATILCTPFVLDYDLVCLALPLAWVVADAQRTGWRPWEKIVLLCTYALPLFARPIGMVLGLPTAPVIVMCLLLVIIARINGRGGQISGRVCEIQA